MRKKPAFLYRNNLMLILLLFFFCTISSSLYASIQIDSVRTTASTCPNNGSITVFAVTSSPAILYSIIAGPVTQAVQTNNFFNSLPAGTYTIRVVNAVSESATQVVTVTGNYTQLDFAPLSKSPYCYGGNDGQIIGNLFPNTGNGPYTWQLIAPSPLITGPQVSDTFDNLIAGNYTVRLTDACGSFRTIVATVPDLPATNLTAYDFISQINMIGCDSALFTLPMYSTSYRFPVTCTFETTSGTFTTTSPTKIDTSSGNGYFVIQQLLTPFTYGNYIRATITDACGSVAFTPYLYSQPFYFCSIVSNEFSGCDYTTHYAYDLNGPGCWSQNDVGTLGKAPFIVEITDLATNLVVNKDTVPGIEYAAGHNSLSGIQVPPLPANNNYSISITDSCGNVFNNNFFIPVVTAPAPKVDGIQLSPDGCVDSIALAGFNISNFSANPAVIFLSGPATMGSTKPGYEYSNTHVYPDTITEHGHFFGTAQDIFFISGLSVGTYQYKVIDSCGHEVFGSLTITDADVSNFGHHFWYKKGCLGQNEIHYSANNPSGVMNITNLTTNVTITKWYSSQDWPNPINDSVLNLPSGSYAISFTYSGYLTGSMNGNTALNYTPLICQTITDTIFIEGYQTPSVKASNSILCHNTISLQLLPDSSKGVPPYQYEIIAGPQTFPVQNSNLFTVNAAGIYTARIYDVCGNASTASITVDTLTFPPLLPIQTTCNSVLLTYGSASYYNYEWTGPNGQFYQGDTLRIDPITAADTGTYIISRMVDINGCKDTTQTAYHLTFPITYPQVKTICTGNSITIGSSIYNSTGIFSDTLTSSIGCDSIVVLDLTVVSVKKDSVVKSICAGQHIIFGTHTYNLAGIYRDTFATASCDSISILNLIVDPIKKDSSVRNICAGQSIIIGAHTYNQTGIYYDTLATSTCDSIVILNLRVDPIKKDSIVRNICAGQTVVIGTHTYNSTGIYRDTLATSTCDSIVILNLRVEPIKKDSIVRNICAGQTVVIGTHTYNSTGIYRDTLATSTCDSIVILNLKVEPIKKDSIVRNICAGQTVVIGTHTYNSTGIYRDTLATSTCDSIVVLNLRVDPIKKDSIVRNICAGQTVVIGIHTYNSTGIYRDTLATSTCDSIVILNLRVDPIKKDSIARSICAGQTVVIGTHTYNSTGIYRDTLATSTCDSIVILNLTVNPNPPISITARPQSVTVGSTVQLGATQSPNYLWTSTAALNNISIQNPVATISGSAWIYLQVKSNPGNCIAMDSVFVRVIPDTTQPCGINTYIYVPNAFTPDGNTVNDVFKIHSNNVKLGRFQVYNRWGEMVFETADISKGWDGVYKGKITPGNYVYWISYFECNRTNKKVLKGSIMLIR